MFRGQNPASVGRNHPVCFSCETLHNVYSAQCCVFGCVYNSSTSNAGLSWIFHDCLIDRVKHQHLQVLKVCLITHKAILLEDSPISYLPYMLIAMGDLGSAIP